MVYLLIALLALGAGLRLYDLTDQPIDFHPTRQLRGAIIARGMYYEMLPYVKGASVTVKNTDVDEATRQRAMDFWQSTGQYEPSILERLVAITYILVGGEHFWIARIYNTLFWILAGLALFDLARRMSDKGHLADKEHLADKGHLADKELLADKERLADQKQLPIAPLIILGYYLVLPFSVQASRSFQPDPGMVVWIVLFAYSLYRWSEGQTWKWTVLTGLCAGIAVLSKAVAAYPVAGAAIALVYSEARRYGRWKTDDGGERHWYGRIVSSVTRILFNPQVWVMALLMIGPTALYYASREGRASEYFSNWTLAFSYLLVEPTFYLRWLRLVQSLVGWWALILSAAGIVLSTRRNRALLLGLWGGYIGYGLFLPYQMYSHSYYHLQLVPIVALSMLSPVQLLVQKILEPKINANTSRIVRISAWKPLWVAIALLLLVFSSWQALIPLYSQDFRNEPAYWQEIASFLPTDGKIMALTQDYGYRLMYYGWRKVILWPNRGEQQLSQMRGSNKEFLSFFAKHTQEMSYFLITAFRQFDDQPDLKQYLYDRYPIQAQGQGYVIFDLKKPK